MAPATYCCACGTASSSEWPSARCAVKAAAKVQPVPWVLRPATRSVRNSTNRRPSYSRSTISGDGKCPPLMMTVAAPSAMIRRAASRRASSVPIVIPASASASGIFGVTRNARRSSSDFIAPTASSSISRSPLFAIITGSTTSHGISRSSTAAATASTMAALASMPVLAACAPMSATTASIWALTRSADSASNARTPSVFCAVTAVMALRPYTPCAANVLRSAWMPAPPLESLPAIVKAVRIFGAMHRRLRG